jgi:hypothetical protein
MALPWGVFCVSLVFNLVSFSFESFKGHRVSRLCAIYWPCLPSQGYCVWIHYRV